MIGGADLGADLGGDPDADVAAIERQLGRVPRGMAGVAHRCPCGQPDVVRTAPRLPDGTPFPTTYYATCPRLTAAVSTLETLFCDVIVEAVRAGWRRGVDDS